MTSEQPKYQIWEVGRDLDVSPELDPKFFVFFVGDNPVVYYYPSGPTITIANAMPVSEYPESVRISIEGSDLNKIVDLSPFINNDKVKIKTWAQHINDPTFILDEKLDFKAHVVKVEPPEEFSSFA